MIWSHALLQLACLHVAVKQHTAGVLIRLAGQKTQVLLFVINYYCLAKIAIGNDY
jgi:hypothetical protein